MNKIIYIGMDVHSSNFTLCSFEPGYGMTEDKIFGQVQFKEDLIKNTEKYPKLYYFCMTKYSDTYIRQQPSET